jgi:hypothetical protein
MRGNSTVAALALGTFDPGTKSVTVLLGPYSYTINQFTMRNNLQVIGVNGTLLTQASAGTAPFVLPSTGNLVAENCLLQGFSLQAAAGSSTNGISMVAAAAGGLYYSAFYDLTIGSTTPFGGNAIRFDSIAAGSPAATDQFISLRNVFAFRALTGPPALRITGAYTGQMSIDDCQFDGTTPSDTGYVNIQIDDGGSAVWQPYSINMRNVTSQHANGATGTAIKLGGVSGFLCEGCHFEDDNGIITESLTGNHGNWGVVIKDSYSSGTVAIDGGSGFIADLDANSSLAFDDNAVNGTPDAWCAGTCSYFSFKGIMNNSSGGLQTVNGTNAQSVGVFRPGLGQHVSTLPAASSSPGAMIYVTNSTTVASEGQTCVDNGGSGVKALAFSNGSVWKCF